MRVRGNDYRVLDPPEWFTPELRVSVIVPAFGGQDKLDLVLAGLARQSYPAELTEVIVVDNGSTPPLRLPATRPPGARLIRCETPGRANARNAGLAEAGGDVIHWLDSDVVLTPGALEAHMRWHHTAPYLVVGGLHALQRGPAARRAAGRPGVLLRARRAAPLDHRPRWRAPTGSPSAPRGPTACTWAARPRSTPGCSSSRAPWTTS